MKTSIDGYSKSKNLGDIYRFIYNSRECARLDIVNYFNLSLPTVTQNLKQLQKSGYIYAAGSFGSTGGRKATIYKCVSDVVYAMGIDITKNHLSIVLIDLDMKIIASRRIRLTFSEEDAYFETLKSEVALMLSGLYNRSKLLGIGISLPAIISLDNKSIQYAKVIQVRGDLYTKLCSVLEFPLRLFNDANSAGLAESWRTHNQNPMIYLSLSSSVGGANMQGQKIYSGVHGKGCEFGHMTIVPRGRGCYCKKKGCLDAYCSANILSDFTDGDLRAFFNEIALAGNKGLQTVFSEYLDHLAFAVNNLRMCYDCDIILGGYVGAYMGDYIDDLRRRAIALNPFEEDPGYIKVCHYKTEASAVGAALYYIDKFLKEF